MQISVTTCAHRLPKAHFFLFLFFLLLPHLLFTFVTLLTTGTKNLDQPQYLVLGKRGSRREGGNEWYRMGRERGRGKRKGVRQDRIVEYIHERVARGEVKGRGSIVRAREGA